MLTELKTAIDMISTSGSSLVIGRKNIRSISSYSSNNIFYFGLVVSDQCTIEEVKMMSKAIEKQAASFVMACVSLIPFHRVKSTDRGAIEDYLKIFHQNMGITTPSDTMGKVFNLAMNESASEDNAHEKFFIDIYKKSGGIMEYIEYIHENVCSVNTLYQRDHLTNEAKFLLGKYDELYQRRINEELEINLDLQQDVTTAGLRANSARRLEPTFTREKIFTDMDMKKANDMVPTFFNANVGFIIEDTSETITKDILIGVKAYVHRMPSAELVADFYNTIIRKRKFLKAIKYFTGEEGTLSDLVFAIKDIKIDAMAEKKYDKRTLAMIKKRKRFANMRIPFIMQNYTPNVSFIMTMNEASYIKREYGIDIIGGSHAKMLMDEYFMFSFNILDQSNEIAYVMFDGHNYQFQEYPYVTLERESNSSDRAMRELYRSMSNRGGY